MHSSREQCRAEYSRHQEENCPSHFVVEPSISDASSYSPNSVCGSSHQLFGTLTNFRLLVVIGIGKSARLETKSWMLRRLPGLISVCSYRFGCVVFYCQMRGVGTH